MPLSGILECLVLHGPETKVLGTTIVKLCDAGVSTPVLKQVAQASCDVTKGG